MMLTGFRLGIGVALLTGCAPHYEGPLANAGRRGLDVTTVEEAFALPAEEFDLATTLLLIGRELDPEVDVVGARATIDAMARRSWDEVHSAESALARTLGLMRGIVFDPAGELVYELDQASVAVLCATRRGNCQSLSGLYGAVAERLGLELEFRAAPHHVWVRVESSCEVETTASVVPDGPLRDHVFYFNDRNRDALAEPFDARSFAARYAAETAVELAATDSERAHELARLAVDVDPHSKTLGALAAVLLESGRPREALAVTRRAAAYDTGDPYIHLRRSQGWRALCDPAAERLALRAALALDPDGVPALERLARRLRDAGRFDEAVDAYERLLGIEPEHLDPGRRHVIEQALWSAEDHRSNTLRELANTYVAWSESLAMVPHAPLDEVSHAHHRDLRLTALSLLAWIARDPGPNGEELFGETHEWIHSHELFDDEIGRMIERAYLALQR